MQLARGAKGGDLALLNTEQAATRLGVTPARVRAMIEAKQLPAQKVGRDWIIEEADLELVAERKVGRPRQKKPPTEAQGKK